MKSDVSPTIIKKFNEKVRFPEFFTYVGNRLSVESCIAVAGILSPDFVEKEGHVFWADNIEQYDDEKFELYGMEGNSRKAIERYVNNFTVSQFFSIWERKELDFDFSITDDENDLCFYFAEILKKNWTLQLAKHFPDKTFEFEIGDDLIDEYGVCMTFWQV